MQNFVPKFIATGFYSGYSPLIPGTVGSAVAIVIYLGLYSLPPWQYFITLAGLTALAIWSSDIAEKLFGEKDCRKIVIDEIVGYLITMFLLPFVVKYIVIGFILFRFFDIIKPYPIRSVQKLSGGVGIVADDFLAGIYGNLLIQLGILFKLI
ncbi:MAG: phosphatidylglycerophosphatase A [bacterium]|nr:phosphatidylglycerophosphatase A [bacterium]